MKFEGHMAQGGEEGRRWSLRGFRDGVEEAHCILRLRAGGEMELETLCDAPVLVNGETLHEGDRRRLGEGSLLAVVAGRMEFKVRDLRVDVNGLGEETQIYQAGGVGEAMTCLICISTVLPHTTYFPRAAKCHGREHLVMFKVLV